MTCILIKSKLSLWSRYSALTISNPDRKSSNIDVMCFCCMHRHWKGDSRPNLSSYFLTCNSRKLCYVYDHLRLYVFDDCIELMTATCNLIKLSWGLLTHALKNMHTALSGDDEPPLSCITMVHIDLNDVTCFHKMILWLHFTCFCTTHIISFKAFHTS